MLLYCVLLGSAESSRFRAAHFAAHFTAQSTKPLPGVSATLFFALKGGSALRNLLKPPPGEFPDLPGLGDAILGPWTLRLRGRVFLMPPTSGVRPMPTPYDAPTDRVEVAPGVFADPSVPFDTYRERASKAGVRLWWRFRPEFLASGKDYRLFFGLDLEDIDPAKLDSEGVPIPTFYVDPDSPVPSVVYPDRLPTAPSPSWVGPVYISAHWFEDGLIPRGSKTLTRVRDLPLAQRPQYNLPLHMRAVAPARSVRTDSSGPLVSRENPPLSGLLPEPAPASDLDAAREDLLSYARRAVAVLEELMDDPGVNDNVRLKAATEVLDRIGLKEAQEVRVEVEHTLPAREVISAKFEAIRARVGAATGSDVVDAEVVDD